jgi:lipopolysaccharide export system permease protein
MLSDFYARNELLAIFASGISLLRFTLPLLIVAIVMSFGLFLFEDNVVVPTYAKKMKMQSEVLEQEESLNNDHIVILTEQGNVIYKADFYDDNLKRLYSLFVLFRNPDKSFNALIYSDNAVWKDNKWVLNGYYEYKQVEDEIIKVPVEKSLMERLIEPPESFRNNSISVQEVSAKEAKLYIEQLERSGLPTSEEKSEYYKKFSFPFVVFLVVFLAIGLSGKTKKNVLIVSLFLCIISVVLFYVLQMITMLMAKFQVIPPIFGGWFPVVLFIFISIILLKYSKT